MAEIKLKLKTTAPLFLKGANPKGDPEFRAASVRGQLRYWLRAIIGAETQDLSKVWERESAVFGSTKGGSAVTVRVSQGRPKVSSHFLLPHRTERQSPDKAIDPQQKTTLTLLTRPGVPMPQDVINALSLWLLLGGGGKRSRRMMGGLQPISVSESREGLLPSWMRAKPQSVLDWAEWYKQALKEVIKVGAAPSDVPNFPILHPQHCCILVGERTFGEASEANRALFGLMRSDKFRANSDAFGYAGNGRRASPVIGQVRKLDDELYFPVITIMRSKPLKPHNWKTVMNDFIDAVQTTFSAHIVYGGKFS